MAHASLADALSIPVGLTAVIGSGGKTSMLYALAQDLSKRGTVILTTSTHMHPYEDLPFLDTSPDPSAQFSELITNQLQKHPVLLVAHGLPSGKITCPEIPIPMLSEWADYVIVEADGARCLPLKAHANYEPVIPRGTHRTICMVGASGFHHPIETVVHRPEIFCGLTDAMPTDEVTPALAAEAIRAEHLADLVFLNQVDTISWSDVLEFGRALQGMPFLAGALKSSIPIWESDLQP